MEQSTINLFLILAVAIINLYTAILTRRNKDTIELLEKNTNSIKDALVASTAKASNAEGHAEGHAEGLAEGRNENPQKPS